MRTFIISVLFLVPFLVFSQEKSNKFYGEGILGGIIIIDDYLPTGAYISLSGGYQVSKYFSSGVELMATSFGSSAESQSISGIGGFAKIENRLYLKSSFGFVLNSRVSTEYYDFERYDYYKNGYYISNTLGYLTKKGLLFGFNFSTIKKVKFKYYATEVFFEEGELFYQNDMVRSFNSYSLVIGYSFPNNRKTNLKNK